MAEANEGTAKVFEEIMQFDELVSDLTRDYSNYIKVSFEPEKAAIEDEIEDILTRLDEFTSLVDMVRGDNTLCLNSTLPEIHTKCDEMESMFQRIDKLDKMVAAIKCNLDVMEEKLVEAEERLDSSSMKKLLSTFQKPLFSKKAGEPKKQVKYEPPEIFKTEDFFKDLKQSSSIDELKTTAEET